MIYIGVDLAWSKRNKSGIAILEDEKILFCDTVLGVDELACIINQYPDAIVGIDAPLKIENETGNRDIEKQFLKDFAKYKLGVYPVNRKLLSKYGPIVSEQLLEKIPQELGKNLFEVYPHATILQLFHNKVLPYKRKQGRDTKFIQEQLNILQNYLDEVLTGHFKEDIFTLKGQSLKNHEDKLDALVCAYTVNHCHNNTCLTYENIFQVPLKN